MAWEYEDQDQPPPPPKSSLLKSMGKEALAATAGNVAAPILTQIDELGGGGTYVGKAAETYRRVADALRDLIPEDRRRDLESSFVPKEGQASAWDAPGSALAMKAASALPIIAGTAATRSPAVAAGLGAVIGEAQPLSDAQGLIEKYDDTQLAELFPSFAQAIEMGLPSHEARKLLLADKANPVTRVLSGFGGAAGAAPFGHIAGGVGRATALGRIGVGTGEAAVGNAIQGGLTEAGEQVGDIRTQRRTNVDVEDAIKVALGAGIEGAAFGAGFAGGREAVTFRPKRGATTSTGEPAPTVTQKVSQSAPDPAVKAALGAEEQAATPTGLDARVAEAQAKIDANEQAPPATPPAPDAQPGVPAQPIPPEGIAVLTEYGAPTAGKVASRPRRQMRENDVALLPPDVVVPMETVATPETAPVPVALPDVVRPTEQVAPRTEQVAVRPVDGEVIPPTPDAIKEFGFQPSKDLAARYAEEQVASRALDDAADKLTAAQKAGAPEAELQVLRDQVNGLESKLNIAERRTSTQFWKERPENEVGPPIPNKIVTVADLPAVVEANPALAAQATRQVAQQAAATVAPKLPAKVIEARGLGPVVGDTTKRKLGTLISKKIATELPAIAESRKAAQEAAAKARAEGKPVVFKPDSTIDLRSVTEQAATEFRTRETQARTDRRAKQATETDNQAKGIVHEFTNMRQADDLQGVLGGDNDAVAQYAKHLDNMVKMAVKDRLPIFNESGFAMRDSGSTPTPHISFLRDAARLVKKIPTLKDPAAIKSFREEAADLAMEQEALRVGDFEKAGARRAAKKALGVGERRVSARDVADTAAMMGAEDDVADARRQAAVEPKPMGTGKEIKQTLKKDEYDYRPPSKDGPFKDDLDPDHRMGPDFWHAVDTSQETGTVRQVLEKWAPDSDSVRPIADMRVRGIMKRVMEKVGDTKVVVLPDGVVADEYAGAAGLYLSPSSEQHARGSSGLIVIERGGMSYHSVLHEAIHVATSIELHHNKYLRRRGEELLEHVRREYKGDPQEYGLTNLDEFVAEAMSNPMFQAELQAMPVPKRLAEFSVRNVWDGFVRLVARSLGLSKSQHNALDAAMRLFDEAAEGQTARANETAKLGPLPMRASTREKIFRKTGTGNEWKLRVKRTLDKVASLTQLGNTSDHLFGPGTPARKLVDTIARMNTDKERMVEKDDPMLRRIFDAQRRYGERFNRFAEFMIDETTVGAYADRALSDQSHITKKNGDPSMDGWYAHGQYPRLAREWAKLADVQDFVNLRKEMHAYFRERQDAMSYQLIDNSLKALSDDGKGSPAMARRIMDGKTTKADEEVLGDALGRIKDAAALSRIAGPYTPLMRHGDFVVQARMDFDTPAGARRINGDDEVDPAGNILEFKSEAAAKTYVMDPKLDMTPKVTTTYIDKNTGKRIGEEDDGTQVRVTKEDAQSEKVWRVKLQDKHVEFFERQSDALKRRNELAGDQRMKDVAEVDIRRQNTGDLNLNFMPEQFRRMAETIKKRDSFKAMPKEAQNELIQQIIDASIGMMGSTRAQQRRLPRTNVQGASNDIARNTQQYAASTAGYLSKLKHQPQADAILKQMTEYTEAARYTGGPEGAKEDMQILRRQRLQEFERRIYSGGDYQASDLFGSGITRWLQLSYLDKLASPAYHIINSMEPWTVSMPVIGGRHGMMKAAGALNTAYNELGRVGTVMAGAKDTVKAFSKDAGFTDYTKSFKERVKDPNISDLFDQMEQTGLMSRNAGMELGRLANPNASMVGRGIDRADLMARQLGTAVEAINRAVTGIAAYRLERGKGSDHDAAVKYALETVHDTMGNYSGWNAPPMFNHPLGRVILQFKKYAQKTYYLLGNQASASLRGDKEAMKAFAGLMATHMAVAGSLGLPLEAVRIGLLAGNMLGVTQYAYDDLEQDLRRGASSVLGKTGGELFSRGLPRALGMDLSTRMSLSSLVVPPFEPKSMKRDDVYSYLGNWLLGAPSSLVTDAIQGFQALGKGDVAEATRLLIPLKIYSDSIKAYKLASEGKKSPTGRQQVAPVSFVEALVQAAGFTPARVAEEQEQTFAIRDQQKRLQQERQELIGDWIKGQPAARNAKWQAILQWNKGKPAGAQIKYQDLLRTMQRGEKEQASGTYAKGVRYTKQNQHLQQDYGFYNTR